MLTRTTLFKAKADIKLVILAKCVRLLYQPEIISLLGSQICLYVLSLFSIFLSNNWLLGISIIQIV